MPKSHRGSILAIDFGSVNTRALLFDVVDGVYCLVAQGRGRTTIDFPNDDVFVGLGHILDDMAVATGRQFFDELGRLVKPEQSDRYGVDYCITTTSAGDSLRVVLVGLLPNISIAPALRAISSFYMQPVAAIHLEDGRDDEERIHEMASSLPDLIADCAWLREDDRLFCADYRRRCHLDGCRQRPNPALDVGRRSGEDRHL